MSALSDQLYSIKSGRSRKIRGHEIGRDGDRFTIDGDDCSVDDILAKLDAQSRSGPDYQNLLFLECQPYSSSPLRHFRCDNRPEHQQLLDEVRKRGNYLYYAGVCKDGDRYLARPPWILDWDSVPDSPTKAAAESPGRWDGGLSCPFCDHQINSTPGRTLHVKHQHPERVKEYFQLLEEIASAKNQEQIVCPFCDVALASTSGRTLHVQGKHPDKLAQYQKMLVGGQL